MAISAATGFTIYGIKSKNKKESDPGDKQEKPSEKNKKNKNIKEIKKLKGEYYEENIRMIREQSGMNEESIKKLIGLMDDENNSFLDNIDSIWIDNDGLYGGLFGQKLTEEIIAKAGLTKGESWVKKFLDTLRGSAKIHKIEKSNKGGIIYMSEDDCARFLFGSSMVEIATADMGCKVCYRLGGA